MSESDVFEDQGALHIVDRAQILVIKDHVSDHRVNVINVVLTLDRQLGSHLPILLVFAEIADFPRRSLVHIPHLAEQVRLSFAQICCKCARRRCMLLLYGHHGSRAVGCNQRLLEADLLLVLMDRRKRAVSLASKVIGGAVLENVHALLLAFLVRLAMRVGQAVHSALSVRNHQC